MQATFSVGLGHSRVSATKSRLTTFVRTARKMVRRDPVIVLAFFVLVGLMIAVIAPGALTSYDPGQIDVLVRLQPPSGEHLFGTDHLGRDILTRVLFAARTTLGSAFFIVVFAAAIGVTIGAVSGSIGGGVDEVIMRIVDLFLAFPVLVLAMAIVAALGPGLINSMVALVVVWWAQYARLTRGLVMQIMERDFVLASLSVGSTHRRLVWRHVLPNCFSPLLVKGTLDVAVAVLTTASLSFLGLGIQPPDPDWGQMVSDGRQVIRDAWWYPTFPGLAIFVTVMSVNLIGDAVRDHLDPRLRNL